MSRFSDLPTQTPDHTVRATRRLVELIEMYLQRLARTPSQEAGDYSITLIARSPASPAAGALAAKADDLGAQQVGANVIFAKPAPSEALEDVLLALKPLLRGESVAARVRWARNPALLDAHEQITLGTNICWSGDAMRRSPQRPGVLEITEEDAPDAVSRASFAFSALWAASKPLSRSHMNGDKRSTFAPFADMGMSVHQRENAEVTIPSIGEDTTRH